MDEAYGGDDDLRQRVKLLLEADDRTRGILERGSGGPTDPPEPAGEPATAPARTDSSSRPGRRP